MVLDQFSPAMDPDAALLSDPVILDALLEAADSPCAVIDAGSRFVRFNKACAAHVRASLGRELQVGDSMLEAVADPAYLDEVMECLRNALAGVPGHRTRWIDGAGSVRTRREIRYLPIRGESGGVVGTLVVAQNQVATGANGEGPPTTHFPLGSLFRGAPVGMLISRLDGTIVEANQAICDLLGFARDQLVGRTMPDITWPEDRGISPLRALADGSLKRYHVQKRYRGADGRPVAVGVTAARILDTEPPQIFAMIEPVGDRPELPAASADDLRTTRALMGPAFEVQLDGMVLLDGGGRILDVNPAFAAMQRRDRETCRGLTPADFEAVRAADEAAQCLAEAALGPVRFQSIHRRGDGTTFPVAVTVSAFTSGGRSYYSCMVRDITSEAALLQERNASGVRYQRLIERSPNITYSFSTNRGGLYYSPQVEQILGYAPAELVAHPFRWSGAVHPDDRVRIATALAVMETEGGFDIEVRLRHKDGGWRWIRDWSTSVERQGEELIVTGQAMDLTALREQERRFQRLVENVPDILYRWSQHPTPRFNYLSAAVERVFGYTAEEILTDPSIVQQCFDPADWRRVLASHADPARDQGSIRLRGRHRDGHPIVVEVRRTIIRDHEGGVIATEGVARDITAAVESEARNALLSAGLEQAAEVVMITDRTGAIIEVNAAFERVTGYAREEVLGRNPSLLKSGFQGEEFYTRMWQTLTAGQIFRGTVVNRKRDGSNYVAEAVITPIRGGNGEITNFVGLQRDVSRERLLDEALRQSQKMEAVGQVTGGVAHDFNNMLTVILANANLLEQQLEAGSEAVTILGDMTAAAQHGTGLVRQLLAYGRKERLSPRPIRLADEFSAFVTILRRAVTEDIEISFAGHDSSWARVDRTAFEQMVLNLVTNARDAMPQGGRLAVRTAQRVVTESEAATTAGDRHPGLYTTICIIDTGKGMPPEVLRRIFEPFYTTKPVGKGTGLGLSMVYGLMQQHGGWVDVTSAVGVGTTVTLGFPVVPPPEPVAPRTAAQTPDGAVGRGELVLVVEDEDALRRVTTRTLENEGYKVIAAPDGEAAWALWQEQGESIALILTDAIMPRLGGADLIRRLRAHGTGVPVILMSGYAADDLRDPTLKEISVVAKPWSGAALAARIRDVLDAQMDG